MTVEQETNHAFARSLSNAGLGDEPDLDTPMADGYKSTWRDKKTYCKYEAHCAWQHGGYTISDNPYIDGTWPHKWWHDAYSELESPNAKLSTGEQREEKL